MMNTKLEDEVRYLALHGLDMGCTVRLMDPGSSRTQAYVTVSLDSLRRVSRNGDAVVEITSADARIIVGETDMLVDVVSTGDAASDKG